MANRRYLAKIQIYRLDATGEKVTTEIKAEGMENLKRKLSAVVDLMEDVDLDETPSSAR